MNGWSENKLMLWGLTLKENLQNDCGRHKQNLEIGPGPNNYEE